MRRSKRPREFGASDCADAEAMVRAAMELLNEEIGIEQKPVKEIVEPATVVPKEASVQVALDACAADGVGSSAVTEDEGKLIGTVSKETMIRKVGGMGHDPQTSPVEPQVNRQTAYCFENQTLGEAEQLMREKQIDEVPVVNEEKVLVGKTKLEKIEACKADVEG